MPEKNQSERIQIKVIHDV